MLPSPETSWGDATLTHVPRSGRTTHANAPMPEMRVPSDVPPLRRISRYEALYQHSQEMNDKRRILQEQLDEEEMQECTFKPKTTRLRRRSSSGSRRGSGMSGVSSSVCSVGNVPSPKRCRDTRERPQPTEQSRLHEELKECTFEPTIHQYHKSVKPERSTSVRGYSQAIKRVQDARNVRRAADDVAEQCTAWTGEVTVPDPFEFSLPKRKGGAGSGRDGGRDAIPEEPLVYVDVTIGRNSQVSGRIGIHETDTPASLVGSFAQVYKLDVKQRERLHKTIHMTMMEHIPSYRISFEAGIACSP